MAGMGRVIGAMRGDFQIPAFEYTGDYLSRLQVYNNVLYAEWELRTSGTLVFVTPQTMDAMLVAGGGVVNNGSAISGWTGAGGSAYYKVLINLENVTSAQMLIASGGGDTTITIGTSTYTAQKGGAANGHVGGSGHTGPYRLFDEPGDQYILGEGRGGANGAPYTASQSYNTPPAVGNGLRLTALPTGGSISTLNATTRQYPVYGGIGYGGGESARWFASETSGPYYNCVFGTQGNPGVVLVRVKLS